MRRFVPTRPDIHERFVRICALEEAKYAAHCERLKPRPGSRKLSGALGRRRPEAEPEEAS